MKNKLIGFVAACCFVIGMLMSCSKETPVQTERTLPPAQGPGAFGLSHLKGLAKTRVATSVQSGENVNFNLGNLKGSTAFYFLLYNIGGKPITNVKLQIPDTSFAVFPSTIDTLIPGGDMGMLPVVKVSAYHGSALDGIGFRSVMPRGENTAALEIEGATKTIDGKDTIVNMAVGLKLKALVMDIEVRGDSGRVIDLTESNCGSGQGRIEGYDVITRAYCLLDKKVTIINTGNVSIRNKIYEGNNKAIVSNETIQPGDSISFELVNTFVEYCFSLDGGNAIVSDFKRLQMNDNGLCYVIFNRMVPNP